MKGLKNAADSRLQMHEGSQEKRQTFFADAEMWFQWLTSIFSRVLKVTNYMEVYVITLSILEAFYIWIET